MYEPVWNKWNQGSAAVTFICHMTTNANIVFTNLPWEFPWAAGSQQGGPTEMYIMDGGRVLGAVEQKVPGSPLSFLSVLLTLVMDKHRLLLELDLWRHDQERVGTLEVLQEVQQALGSTEDLKVDLCLYCSIKEELLQAKKIK